ncbi:MAG TPA: DUF3795 domain-containing protein [Methanotrichaceae archaeon]|nr:DUF3795 domain-containing protein [Methanotrichaceae archaeon]
MSETTLAYCGIECDKCPVLIATSKDDDALRQKNSEGVVRSLWRDS